MGFDIMKNTGNFSNLNTRRYFWIIAGYWLFSIYIRKVAGESNPNSGHLNLAEGATEPSPGTSHHGNEHGIQIARVDFENVETPFIIALWIFCASLAKIVFHMAPKFSHIFPESCLLIFVGVAIGLLLFHTSNSVEISPLTPKTFFFYMLPPIILDAGYFMPNRLFFSNLGTILLFAVVGTLWNTFSIGLSLWGLSEAGIFGVNLNILQIFVFSALVSAVDPVAVLAVFEEIHVNEILYIVVFGESLLNDAVTVVLYHTFEDFTLMGLENVTPTEVIKGIASFPVVALGGTAIGIIWGLLTGFVTRFTNHVRVIEPIFVFVMAYLSYLCAETFHMSGILAITFCGITMKNYVEANISHKSHTTVKYAMKMLSSSSETIIFMLLGVSTIHDHVWNWWFIVFTILFCTVYRTIGVIVLSALANRFRLHKLGAVDQFVMSYGGLRGAVAFALVLLIPEDAADKEIKNMFTTTTICVVYFTVFLQGITIKPLVQWLKVSRAEKRKHTMNERIHERLFDHTMSVMQSILGTYGQYNIRDKFKHFDNTYIRPCLIRDHTRGAEPKILETYSKLTMRDAMDMMQRNGTGSVGTNLNKMMSAESMAALIRNQKYESGTDLAPGSSAGTFQSPSDAWNLDLQELEYSLTKKDMSDAKIHHLLAEELYKPSRRQRRLSYSRHAVDDQDLGEALPICNYRTPMNPKKMVTRRRNGKSVREPPGGRENGHVTFGNENPTFNMVDEKFQRSRKSQVEPADDGGIYFIAGPRSEYQLDWNERRWSGGSVFSNPDERGFMEPSYPHAVQQIAKHFGRRYSQASRGSEYDDTPTITETSLPWRRENSALPTSKYLANSTVTSPSQGLVPQAERSRFRVSPARKSSTSVRADEHASSTTPVESTLPWKRDEDDGQFPIRQDEFPAWSSNKDYLAYNSPSNTFLGGLDRNDRMPSVIGMFKRDSVSSGTGSRRGSVQSRLESPRHSIGSNGSYDTSVETSAQGMFSGSPTSPPVLSRRGSQFGVSIPERVTEETDHDLMDIEGSKKSSVDSNKDLQLPSSSTNIPKGHQSSHPLQSDLMEGGEHSKSQTQL